MTYSSEQLVNLAKVSASIMGIESEHRVLGRVISNLNLANNRNYETTDGITAVSHGSNSAVVALTPFLTPSTGAAYSLEMSLANQSSVSLPCVLVRRQRFRLLSIRGRRELAAPFLHHSWGVNEMFEESFSQCI